MKSTLVLLLSAAILTACAREDKLLDAHQLLGRSPEQLKERLGEPRNAREETEHLPGWITWRDIDGVRVFVLVQRNQTIYVAYTFREFPEDEDEALSLLNITKPRAEPQHLSGRARRWTPYGNYDRLTVNPDTGVISLGNAIEWASEEPPPASADTSPAAES